MTYEPHSFNIPELAGISSQSVNDHIELYKGYVKNFTGILSLINDLRLDATKNTLAIAELQRRLPFEFDGMRLHENYFAQLEGGSTPLNISSAFATQFTQQYGSLDMLIPMMKNVGMMRGPGWAILYYDTVERMFQLAFVGEQHQGHFVGLPVILSLDVWEHAFVLDQGTLGKGKYIDAFFANINWSVVENRFANLS
jgi:Fe-Mn family superoxide dismutase